MRKKRFESSGDNMYYPHWEKEDFDLLTTTNTYRAMAEVAFRILPRIPKPVVQVCGPLTTGGLGSLEKNLKMFHVGIRLLLTQGKNIFDQRPFEEPMQRLKILQPKGLYPVAILDDFYLPILESGFIHELHFLPGWQDSRGARWEHEQALRLGISIHYLPEGALEAIETGSRTSSWFFDQDGSA